MRYVFIMNPRAGEGKAEGIIRSAVENAWTAS